MRTRRAQKKETAVVKVTPPTPPSKSAPDANKTTGKRSTNAPSAGDTSTVVSEATGGGRDFASVLKDVSRTSQHDSTDEKEGASERRESRAAEGTERERETERRQDDDNAGGETSSGGQMSQRGSAVRETATTLGETTGARAILHIADLERILATVRTQTTLGGRREVTLELQRSVLEGLRIKISTDDAGRVTAEFVAATERVRAQLDARSADLADLLRSRGVDLASLKTSVGAEDTSGQQDGRDRQQFSSATRSTATAADARRNHLSGVAQDEADALSQQQNATDSDSTYRA